MGYHIFFVREKSRKKEPISREEIVNYISSNAGFSFSDNGNYLNIKKHTNYGYDVYFIYKNGELFVKNPSDIQLDEFILLANRLGGRARGENLETYLSNSETFIHPNDVEKSYQLTEKIKYNKSKKRRKSILWKVITIVLGIALGVAIGIARK